jgi:predicted  nucleic acid-binding Zn-ribbon protein
MLQALRKKLGIAETGDVSLEELVIQINKLQEDLALSEQSLEEVKNALEAKDDELQELNGKLSEYQEIAKEAEAKAEAERIAAVEAAQSVKKEKLSAILGTANPALDSTFEAIKGLEGEALTAVLNGFQAAFVKEAETPEFKEVGITIEGKIDENQDEKDNATARILKAKYN